MMSMSACGGCAGFFADRDTHTNHTDSPTTRTRSIGLGQCLDVILVRGRQDNDDGDFDGDTGSFHGHVDVDCNSDAIISCNDFHVSFPSLSGYEGLVRVYADGEYMDGLDMICTKQDHFTCRFLHGRTRKPSLPALKKLWQRAMMVMKNSTTTLETLHLNLRFQLMDNTYTTTTMDANRSTNSTSTTITNTTNTNGVLGEANAALYAWHVTDQIIVCDIDGTITKSNITGLWDTVVTKKYQHVHDGVCSFLQQLLHPAATNSHQHPSQQRRIHQTRHVVYLTSRPLSLASTTREFLQSLQQKPRPRCSDDSPTTTTPSPTDFIALPRGPMLCNTTMDINQIILSELIWKTMHLAKIEMLQNHILFPFRLAMGGGKIQKKLHHHQEQRQQPQNLCFTIKNSASSSLCPLVLGIGNAMTDTIAYHTVGVPLSNIYQITKPINTKNTNNKHHLKNTSLLANASFDACGTATTSTTGITCFDKHKHNKKSEHQKQQQQQGGTMTMTMTTKSMHDIHSFEPSSSSTHKYRCHEGTQFSGYTDLQLLKHVEAQLSSLANATT